MRNASQRQALHTLLRRARKVRVALMLGLYTALSPVGYTLITLACAVPTRDPLSRARRLQRLSAGAYRFMHDWLRWTRIARFDHRGALKGLPAGPFVLVANHPTLMDVTSIMAVLGGGVTIAKPSLFRRRSLYPLLAGAGHLEGPGDSPLATGRVIDAAVERIGQGFRLVVFPEGTRSRPDGPHRFGRAAFEIACRARVPVVSVGIRCRPAWLTKEVLLFDPPHPTPELSLTLLATDDPAHVDYDSHRLRRTIEQRFLDWLDPERQAVATRASTVEVQEESPCPTHSKIA